MTDKTNKPVIFLAFANDRDDTVGYLRNLPDEARRLREVLEPAEQAGLCEVVVRSNSTAGDIFKVFQDPEYRNRIAIFHYGGHANGYQLLLESAAGQAAAADAGGLAAFLGAAAGTATGVPERLFDAAADAGTAGREHPGGDLHVAGDRRPGGHGLFLSVLSGAGWRGDDSHGLPRSRSCGANGQRGQPRGRCTSVSQDDAQSRPEADRWPWNLYLREGSEIADQWNLPEAVNDPLFGLPPLPEQDLPESPYRHLNWFTRKDAEVFFGRGHQIRELYDRLTAPRTAPIILFYGQSGVGKSSVLDAGLIPRLEQNYEVRYLRRAAKAGCWTRCNGRSCRKPPTCRSKRPGG